MVSTFIKPILAALGVFALCRLIFIVYNFSSLHIHSFHDWCIVFITGLRFDLAATAALLIPYAVYTMAGLFFSIVPTVKRILYMLPLCVALLLNLIDTAYYGYAHKRSTWNFLLQNMRATDLQNNAWDMLRDFWIVPVAFILIAVFIWQVAKFLHRQSPPPPAKWISKILQLLAICAIIVLGIRGGLQLKPLRMIDSAQYNKPANMAAVLNTPFCVIKTQGELLLTQYTYYATQQQLDDSLPLCHTYANAIGDTIKKNVVVIILESFGKEYIGFYNGGTGFTPFLDSLCQLSSTFKYSFANASRSMEGIPAITASIPYLMDEAFISSPYNTNKINSIATCLSELGYSTAFFHGGNNGTMNFDSYCRLAGFDYYFGRNEYGLNDYDGNWGVYDEPFYKFTIDKINTLSMPFFTTVFSLSSHHPYSIPAAYAHKFPKGTLPIHQSIGYADYALQTFFDNAKQQPWYDNTLFVITADHTSSNERYKYRTLAHRYAIPIIWFQPGQTANYDSTSITQQIDIMPTLLQTIGYEKPFFAFGTSWLAQSHINIAWQYYDGIYQAITDSVLIQYDGEKCIGAYKYNTDTMYKNNMASEGVMQQKNGWLLKSMIQQHNVRMQNNKLTCDE